MECPACKAPVSEHSRFCTECGAPISIVCPSCHYRNQALARFCARCGGQLASPVSHPRARPEVGAALAPPAESASSSAERRQITVMFCDLVGSIALAGSLDPEDLGDVIGSYHRCVATEVARLGGFVAKYMGDEALAYFGYPRGHEDDAERAARAGLAIVSAVAGLQAPGQLHIRVGIETGLVVVGELVGYGESQERGIVGETPNLASRLQTLAKPDSVVIGPRTRLLLGDLFEYRDLGNSEIKGIAQPVRVYEVVGQSLVQGRWGRNGPRRETMIQE